MGLIPGGAVMQSHADVDDAAALTGLQWLEGRLAHCESAQCVDVKHCRHTSCSITDCSQEFWVCSGAHTAYSGQVTQGEGRVTQGLGRLRHEDLKATCMMGNLGPTHCHDMMRQIEVSKAARECQSVLCQEPQRKMFLMQGTTFTVI